MDYILIFDFSGEAVMRVKINRLLREIGAVKVQNSVWKSDNLKELTKIAIWVRNAGGSAHILEEKIIY